MPPRMTDAPGQVTLGPRLDEVVARLEAQDEEFRRVRAEDAPAAAIAREVMLARARIGLTQQQLAAALGTSVPAISRLESGRHGMTVRTLQRLADTLGIEFAIRPRNWAHDFGHDPHVAPG